MGTLGQGCLTSLQNCNLAFGLKKQHLRVLPLVAFRPSQNPSKFYSFSSRLIKFRIRTSSNSGLWNQSLKTLEAPTPNVDLEVTVRSASMVVPLEETVRRTMFLSNLDQAVNVYTSVILFFSANPNFPPEVITKKLEAAYRRVLVHYDFLAGRLRWNHQLSRLEIECNSAGAGFVTASSMLTQAEIGDLVCPHRGFEQLITRNLDNLCSRDNPLFVLQVTSFKCGGIALGITFNHTTLDGIGLLIFLEHLGSFASDNPELPFVLCNNRRLLDARSPPRVTQPHLELIDLGENTSIGHEGSTPPVLSFVPKSDELLPKVLLLNAENIMNLKKKAMLLGNNTNVYRFSSGVLTSFNVVTAHVWRCMAITKYNGEDQEKVSVITFPINIRSRLRPRLPATYVGNAVMNGYGMATYREIEEKPFSYLVDRVAEGVRRVKDEYVRSVIDWRELHNGYVHGDVFVTPWWWELGFSGVEFPWGKTKCFCPLVPQWSNVVILLQDNREVKNKGVNVFVSLPRKELDKFQELFYKFLSA